LLPALPTARARHQRQCRRRPLLVRHHAVEHRDEDEHVADGRAANRQRDPRALMNEQNATSLQDALRNVPGLGFSVGDGQRDQVTIRGFNNITDQYVDGIRDDSLYYRDLSNVERVDVLKGPAAVLYGRGSAGGLINRVLKKPQATPTQEVGVTLGTEGERRGEFDPAGTRTTQRAFASLAPPKTRTAFATSFSEPSGGRAVGTIPHRRGHDHQSRSRLPARQTHIGSGPARLPRSSGERAAQHVLRFRRRGEHVV